MTSFVAHQGGWDELLMFLVPIALAFFVIRGLERRGRKANEPEPQEESQNTTP